MNAEADIIERLDTIIELLRERIGRRVRLPGPQETKEIDDGIQDEQPARQSD